MLLIINKNGVNFATSSPAPGDGTAGVNSEDNNQNTETIKPKNPKNSNKYARDAH